MNIPLPAFFLFGQFCLFFSYPALAFAQQSAAGTSTVDIIPPTSPGATNAGWLPPDVDARIPPVEPQPSCNLEMVLREAGQRIQELVENVQRFTATETLLHESINKTGAVAAAAHRKYDYVVSIREFRPGSYEVEEFRRNGSSPLDYPGGTETIGLPALILIFHPFYSGDFSMTCEGLGTLKGRRAWQVYFRQKPDKPNRMRSYRTGNGPAHPVDLKGRAWFLADSYQIVGLQTDLIHPLPEIQLTADHTVVEYAPVHFNNRGVDMWLPQTAEVYSDWKGKRIHRRLGFSDFFLFAVDDKQKISTPTPVPESSP
jgi:hypothetical protein